MPELHPWNTDFSWTDRGAGAFDRDGFVVVPDLLTADELAPVVAEVDRFEAEADAFLQSTEDGRLSIAETGAITFSLHKAYILQYAPDGAEILRGDADAGPPLRRERADAPDRQWLVLSDGRPVR